MSGDEREDAAGAGPKGALTPAELAGLGEIAAYTRAHFLESLAATLDRRRSYFVFTALRRLRGAGMLRTGDGTDGWVPVATLSAFRKVVGGRFDNLKRRWVGAGFPLREHRADREAEARRDEEGWQELIRWLGTQGYEVRLGEEGEDCLFRVRRVEG